MLVAASHIRAMGLAYSDNFNIMMFFE